MKRLAAGLVAVAVVLAVTVLVAREPTVDVEPVRVTVTGDAGPVTIDAAVHTVAGDPEARPALLLAHGFGSSRAALTDVAAQWARRGHVVVTWSARGFGESGGQIGLNRPDAEIADVSALIDLLADRDTVVQDGPRDPRVAVAGGSYGGAAALLAGAADERIDAVVAVAAWHDLAEALAPGADAGPGVLKDQWLSALFTSALAAGLGGLRQPAQPEPSPADANPLCGRFTEPVCAAYLTASGAGVLTPSTTAGLGVGDPAGHLHRIAAPTLIVHALDDTLFSLGQSLANAEAVQRAGAPVRLRWVPGDHGGIGGPDGPAGEEVAVWLRAWLHDDTTPPAAAFAWTDAASGTVREGPLPLTQDDGLRLTAAGPTALAIEGRSVDEVAEDDPAGPDTAVVVHPPGGLPAAVSALPGTGALGGLLPAVEVPGQHVSLTTPALDRDVTLLGRPSLRLDATPTDAATADPAATSNAPRPALLVKLFDVSPSGANRLLHSTVTPIRVSPDGPQEITLPPLAHRIVAGNRLRLVLATTDQGFATGQAPAVILIATDDTLVLRLPVDPQPIGTSLPVLVRVALPILLLAGLALAAQVATRRHERRLAAEPAAADAPVVRVRGLAKTFEDGKVAVDGLDLTVERGQVFGLLGPNGAGKTTTMRMLLGLIAPTAGTVELLGHRVVPGHPVLGQVGVLVEGPGFPPYLTGRQNLESFWRAGGQPMGEADLDRALRVADLGAALDRPVRTYSHGMRQRLAIAQALLGDPELLVLDEPTDGLDPEQIRGMRQLLARLGAEGITVLVSSHLLAEVEQMCTHVAVVNAGRVVRAGPVAELRGSTRSIVVRTDDVPAARAALTGLVGEDALDLEADGVAVSLNGVSSADVVATLVRAGVPVSSATPRGRLEDAFLELTGGRR